MFITIVDYGAGNLRSVQKALEALGFKAILTKDPREILSGHGIILPGVGAFDSAILELRKLKLEIVIEEAIAVGKPLLGICLGYQLLFDSSEEGKQKGLSILKGKVKKFDFNKTSFSNFSIPHMGWNGLIMKHNSSIFHGINSGAMVYFAHSYYCIPDDNLIISTITDYGMEFASSVSKGNVFGIQFHPEKSGNVGLKILKNFGDICLK